MTRSESEVGTRRGYAFGAITLFIVSPLIAWAPTLATGTGWSPLVYLLSGLLLGTGIGAVMRQFARRPWIWQTMMLLAIATASATLGYFTARPDPAGPFAMLFKAPPPSGVTGSSARVQWHNGQTILLRFRVDDATLATLVKLGQLRPSEYFADVSAFDRPTYVNRAFYMSGIADPQWKRTIAFESARLYEIAPGRIGPHTPESGTLLVNERGEAWAMYNWGG